MFKHFDVLNKTHLDSFVSRIRIACVTENDSIKALIVDCDDDVYAIGKDYDETFKPFKLDAICKSGVCDFSFGRGHVVAVTDEGNVFAWGQNDRHQCGNGGKEYVKFPMQINFDNEKIIKVMCGWDHTLALTDSGSIYAWGRNYTAQCGTGTRDNVKFPEKLVIGKVKSIVCGAGHSIAILENGQVYGWGENGDGQLGLDRETHCELSPSHVKQLNGIKKVVCGMYHTIALSTDGRLYTCGYNEYVKIFRDFKSICHNLNTILK
jgi:RCC1 and BTB domain-containing protein